MRAVVYILICLLFGSTWKVIQVGVMSAPPLMTAAARFWVAIGILALLATLQRRPWPSNLRTWLRISYPGLWMYGLHFALIYFAEQRIPSSLTAVLFGSFPFWVAFLSHFQLDEERVRWQGWLGILTGFGGVVLISCDQLQLSGELFIGTILALAGTYAAAHGVVAHRRHFVRSDIVTTAAVQMIIGCLLLTLFSVLLESPSDFTMSSETIGSVLYLAVFGTVVAFLGYYWLLARIKVVTVALMAFVTPLVAIGIGLLSGEELTATVLLGTVLILSGIVLVVRPRRPVVPDLSGA